MKLHLPKLLLTAVLAVTAMLPAVQAEEVTYTYSGTIYTWAGTSTTYHSGPFYQTTLSDETFTVTDTTSTWQNSSQNTNTIRFSSDSSTGVTSAGFQFSGFSVGGFIVESDTEVEKVYAANGSTVANEASRTISIGNADSTSLSTIEKDFEVKSSGGVITLVGTQKWDVSTGATYKINAVSGENTGGSITNNGTIIQNGGTVDFNLAAISGSGSYTVSSGKLQNASFASGTTLGIGSADSVFSSVTMASGSILDLTALTLSADTAAVSSGITLNSGISVSLSAITAGTTVKLFDQTVENVTLIIDGKAVGGRTQFTESNGAYTFTAVGASYSDMVWAGGDNGTWNSTNTNWNSATGGNGIAFANGDSVSFTSTAAVDVAEAVSVAGMTVSGANTELSLTRSNSGYISGDVTVTDGAKLIIKSETGSTGFVRGNIEVSSGTLQFDAKDVTGYNGGDTATKKITIANGAALQINHTSNETFSGELVLNGKLKGIGTSAAQFDFYGGSAKLTVEDAQNAVVENATLRLRQNNTQITVGAGATLTTAGVLDGADFGNGIFLKKGSGEMIIGGIMDVKTAQVEAGTMTVQANSTLRTELRQLNGTVNVGTADHADVLLSTARVELGDSSSSSTAYLNILQGATVKVTGDKNGTSYGDVSLLLGEWGAGASVKVDGVLLASSAKALVGDASMAITINGTGVVAVKGFGVASVKDGKTQSTTITLNDNGKLILGDGGIADNLKTPSITLNAGTIAASASETTLGAAMTLGSSSGTTIDTALYAFAEDGNSISKSNSTAQITISGALSGSGKLIKDGDGTLNLTSSNTYTGGTEVKAGKVVAATGAALGTGGATISGGSLEVTSDAATISQSTAGTSATIEHLSSVDDGNGDTYNLANSAYQVNNAKVEVANTSDITVSNRLVGVDLVNNGTGTITAGNGYNDFTSISAVNGNITLKGLAAEAGTGNVDTVQALSIGEGKTLSVYTNWTGTLTEATVKVADNGAASFATDATLNGNLILGSGVTVTLEDALTMGSTLELGTGMTLDGAMLTSITGLTEANPTVDLFTGVDGLTLTGGSTYDADTSLELGTVQLNTYFSNVTNPEIYLGYDAANNIVYAGLTQSIPEPTTATLSLLALAGLAARRRRK